MEKITDAVHAERSLIVSQLWHVGRISHPDLLRVKHQFHQVPSNRKVPLVCYDQNVNM